MISIVFKGFAEPRKLGLHPGKEGFRQGEKAARIAGSFQYRRRINFFSAASAVFSQGFMQWLLLLLAPHLYFQRSR